MMGFHLNRKEMFPIKSRQLEILIHLMDAKKSTYTELAQLFEVSKKTIMRDIDKLSGMGIPIYTQSGYGGGIFLSPNYRFHNSFFTGTEIEDIILALHIAKHLRKRQEKNTVLQKLEILIPELAFLKELDFDKYLKIELLSKPITAQTPICHTINKGLDEEIYLDITVRQKHYTIAPLHYILRPDGLYLYSTDGTSFFTFEVEHISECKTTSQTFDRTEYFPK